ncbi:unnamed protein product [Thelazia callipaeda]|uniref:Uncharacterized protein n=1 Tax=Thelazia callipaeda TaxID=103827 RepID=A0A0N5D7Q0_THECL|nr:unnamed protein product [Thelazia callipaeda]
MTTLSSSFCRRCCIIKDHIDKKLIRCNVPIIPDDTVVDLHKLPLSEKLVPKARCKTNTDNSDLKPKKQRLMKTFREKMKHKSVRSEGESSKSVRSPSKV